MVLKDLQFLIFMLCNSFPLWSRARPSDLLLINSPLVSHSLWITKIFWFVSCSFLLLPAVSQTEVSCHVVSCTAEKLTRHGTEGSLCTTICKKLRPPVQIPSKNWILPTTKSLRLELYPSLVKPWDETIQTNILITALWETMNHRIQWNYTCICGAEKLWDNKSLLCYTALKNTQGI